MQLLMSNNHKDVSIGKKYYSQKSRAHLHKNNILDLLLKKSKIFEWKVSLLFVVPDAKKHHHIWLR